MTLRLMLILLAATISGVVAFGIIIVILINAQWGYPLSDISQGLACLVMLALGTFGMVVYAMTFSRGNQNENTSRDVGADVLPHRTEPDLFSHAWPLHRALIPADTWSGRRARRLLVRVVRDCADDRRRQRDSRGIRADHGAGDTLHTAVQHHESESLRDHDSSSSV